MMTESSAFSGKPKAAIVAAVMATIGAPIVAHADVATKNSVKSIETRQSDRGREIVITTAQSPTFSVFRLSDPFRILVDVNDASLAEAMETVRFDDDPVLKYVSTQTFADDASSIVRVEIGLDHKLGYDVRAEGYAIIATVEVPVASPTRRAKPTAAKRAEAKAVAIPVAAAKLGKLERKVNGEVVVLTAPLSGGQPKAEDVSILHLDNPSRVVVDIAGANAEPKFQNLKVKRKDVRRARVGTSDDGVRIVVDMNKGASQPKVAVDAVGNQLVVSVAPTAAPVKTAAKPAPATPAIAKKATKPAPKKAVAKKKTAPEPDPVIDVADVRFEQKDGFVRLSVDLAGDAVATKDGASSRGLPVLRIKRAKLPEAFVRTLDTTQVAAGVVTSVSTYNEGEDVVIAASIGKGTEHRHWRKGNRLLWDFRSNVQEPAVKTAAVTPVKSEAKVLTYQKQATSGFEAISAQTAATLVPAARKRYRGRRISLDLKDADIHNVLRLLADVSKLNIVAADDVTGRVTLKLRNVPWDQALDIILQSKRLDKTRNGNIIRVAPIEVLEQEEQLRLSRQDARIKLEPLAVRLIPVNYANAAEVQTQVKTLLSDRGGVSVDRRTNVLVVEDIAEVLLKVERLVRTLDTQTPQVLIEARIVEANTNFVRDLGIQWGGSVNANQAFGTQTGLQFPSSIAVSGGSSDSASPTAGITTTPNLAVNLPAGAGTGSGGSLGFVFGSAGGAALLQLRLSAAEQNGKTKIISSPKIVTLDNTEARILSGEKIPITVLTANGPATRFISAFLELKVVPHVTSDGAILMNIDAKKNELSQRVDIVGTPGILSREAKTIMLVQDGDTAVLGGIYRRTASETKNYVPFIGQVPVLGWLFKKTLRSDSREELLIFISPRIVNRSQALVSGR